MGLDDIKMKIILRSAKLKDSDAIFILARDCATSFKPERGAFDTSLKQIIRDNAAHIVVATIDKNVIAYCLGFDHYAFYANGRVSLIEEIMVHEDFRRRGIGRMLVEEFESWAVSRQSKLAGLATRRAAQFYDALDYENSAVFYRKLL